MPHAEYIRRSEGAKAAVLFIHGFLGSPKHFEKFIKEIPNTIAVHNLLLEGHGGSVSEFGRASMAKWKKQADDAAKALIEKYGNIIIVGHSMGTFFAMEAALKYPENVKCIILMQSPLKIGVKPAAAINTFKSFFNFSPNDPTVEMYKNSHSVKLTMRVWEYIGWIPRYLELFAESKRSRNVIKRVKTPTYIFQSKKDELVSMHSVKYIPDNENIQLNILEKSAHFIYDEKEFSEMTDRFKKLTEQYL